MKMGLQERALAPEDFWRATLREIVLDADPSTASLRRSLNELMKQWPD